MFGGLTFLRDGRMCCGIVGDDLMVRVTADEMPPALSHPRAVAAGDAGDVREVERLEGEVRGLTERAVSGVLIVVIRLACQGSALYSGDLMTTPDRKLLTREILLGFWKVHILHHAAEHPVVGQWVLTELRRHGYDISPGTLYPLLKRMERNGWLRCEVETGTGPRGRRYYHLTAAGAAVLAIVRDTVVELHHEVVEEAAPHPHTTVRAAAAASPPPRPTPRPAKKPPVARHTSRPRRDAGRRPKR